MPTHVTKPKVQVNKTIAPEPISAVEMETAERALAHLIALSYIADHPEFFRHTTPTDGTCASRIVVTSGAFDGSANEHTEDT